MIDMMILAAQCTQGAMKCSGNVGLGAAVLLLIIMFCCCRDKG